MNSKISATFQIKATSAAQILGALALAVYGLITYTVTPIVNAIAITIALYAACSIIVGGGFEKLLTAFTVSVLFTIASDLCFSSLQPFIAFCTALFIMLVGIRYSLIRDHDSGWFGALCATMLGLIFLLPIEIILVMTQLFLF